MKPAATLKQPQKKMHGISDTSESRERKSKSSALQRRARCLQSLVIVLGQVYALRLCTLCQSLPIRIDTVSLCFGWLLCAVGDELPAL